MVKVGGAFIQIIISSHDKPSLKINLGFTTKGFRRPGVALAHIGFESQPDISLLLFIRSVSINIAAIFLKLHHDGSGKLKCQTNSTNQT